MGQKVHFQSLSENDLQDYSMKSQEIVVRNIGKTR